MGGIDKVYDKAYFNHPLRRQCLHSRRNRDRLKEVLSHKKDGTLLDVGFGNGNLLLLASPHFDVYGIDISKDAFDELDNVFKGKLTVGNISEADLKEECYDVITAFNVLEHMEDPGASLKKIFRSLKIDGLLIGSVPNNSCLIGRASAFIGKYCFDRSHVSLFEPGKWLDIFKKADFRDISFFGEFALNANASFYIRGHHWKLISNNLMFSARRRGQIEK